MAQRVYPASAIESLSNEAAGDLLIERGDGVFSAAVKIGDYTVYKALQGATCWECEHVVTLRRTFHNTFAEAKNDAEASTANARS